MKDLRDKGAFYRKAEQAGDLRTALIAVREGRSTMELLTKLSGDPDDRTRINVLNYTAAGNPAQEEFTVEELEAWQKHRQTGRPFPIRLHRTAPPLLPSERVSSPYISP